MSIGETRRCWFKAEQELAMSVKTMALHYRWLLKPLVGTLMPALIAVSMTESLCHLLARQYTCQSMCHSSLTSAHYYVIFAANFVN